MNPIDFLPQSFRNQRKRRSRRWIEGLIVVTVAALLVVLHLEGERGMRSLRNAAALADGRGADMQGQSKELSALQNEYRGLAGQLRVYNEIVPPIGLTQVLAAISEVVPESIAFTDIRLESKRPTPGNSLAAEQSKSKKSSKSKAPPPPKAIDPLMIELTGLSPSDERIADFVGKLAESPLFKNVKLEFSRPTEHDGLLARSFRVSMQVPFDRTYRMPRNSGKKEGVAIAD